MPCSLVVFDLDGTLIDSAPDLAAAVNAMLAHFGAAPLALAEVRGMIGEGMALLVARALAARGREGVDAEQARRVFLERYTTESTCRTVLYPGVRSALETLRADGVTLAVCTNKPESLALGILERLRLARYFAQCLGGDSLPFRKPDPRMLLTILKAHGTAATEALLVGDSEIDAATAREAGVPFVLMTHGYRRGPIEDMVCAVALERFDELPAFVRRA